MYAPLVTVAITESSTTNICTTQGVKDIADADIWSNSTHVDWGVHVYSITTGIVAIDGSSADTNISILPYTEITVDE